MKPALVTLLALPLLAQRDFSAEKQRVLNEHLATRVRQSSKPLANAEVNAYVRGVGASLLSRTTGNTVSFTFETIQSDRSEPEGLPGGEIFVPANFILAARDESEFAAMLAHAMGHVVLGHGTREMDRAKVVNLANVPLVFLGPMHADSRSGSVLAPLAFFPELRSMEMEADRFAVELVSRAGYDPRALRSYLDRTLRAESRLWPAAERAQRLSGIVQALETTTTQVSARSSESRIRGIVRTLVLGSSEDRIPTLRRKGEVQPQ
jgi:predicted Zn-dependent protease